MSSKDSTMSRGQAEAVLRQEETGTLCLSRDGQPYAVPVSYAYLDGEILFHSKSSGRKLDILRANPRVCFAVSRHPDRTRPHRPEGGCSFRYESVLCLGKARVIEDPRERLEKLKAFKDFFYRRLGIDPSKDPVTEKAAASTACVVIAIEEMTGKSRLRKA